MGKVRLRVSAMINGPQAQAERRASIWKAQGIQEGAWEAGAGGWPKPMDSRCRWGEDGVVMLTWGGGETRRALKWSMGSNWCRSRTWWFNAFTRRGREAEGRAVRSAAPKLDAKPAGRETQASFGCGTRGRSGAVSRFSARAVICSVLSREEGQERKAAPGKVPARPGPSVLCLQGRLNVTNARLM